jgi:N6-adenosine-specific RNA methylase IME4
MPSAYVRNAALRLEMIPDNKVTLNGNAVDVGLFSAAAREQIAKALTDDEHGQNDAVKQERKPKTCARMGMSLAEIAARIKLAHQAAATSLKCGIEHAITAGELLIEAKKHIPHGQWLPWLGEHCGITPRSAQGYMKLARNRDKLEANTQALAHLTIEGALKSLAAPSLAIASLETEEARNAAVEAIENGADIRKAVGAAKKLDYNARIQTAKPKTLEGTYRIILADPPWKYHCSQVNSAEDHHYDSLNDTQLCNYRPGSGKRTVKELADKNAVLFLWVTAPMLERCFPIIEAWGFKYKTFFVWDKVKHNVGHYNSVRHELLLICTRGSCMPDTGKLIDSVQTIERSDKHSEKPEEFYDIIDAMYDHGRKLELFSRKARIGWDADGNEAGRFYQRGIFIGAEAADTSY